MLWEPVRAMQPMSWRRLKLFHADNYIDGARFYVYELQSYIITRNQCNEAMQKLAASWKCSFF